MFSETPLKPDAIIHLPLIFKIRSYRVFEVITPASGVMITHCGPCKGVDNRETIRKKLVLSNI